MKTAESVSTIKFLTHDELKRFFRAIEKSGKSNPHMLTHLIMFHIIYFCGLRASEVWMLRVDQYNPNWELFVKRLKGSISNTIRLDESRKKLLDKYLREYRREDVGKACIIDGYDLMFKSKTGRPITGDAIFYLFRKYGRDAKLPAEKLHPHVLKHTVATMLLETGLDIFELKNYIGHANVLNTQIYSHFSTRQQDAMYEKIAKGGGLVS